MFRKRTGGTPVRHGQDARATPETSRADVSLCYTRMRRVRGARDWNDARVGVFLPFGPIA